ncbi:MAG: LytR family transcriptional regulator [Hamadaea sp.]|nr:LytR family transcriptional regulator [Hamadaea sp.]
MANSSGGVYGRPRKPNGDDEGGSTPPERPRDGGRTSGRASVSGSRPGSSRGSYRSGSSRPGGGRGGSGGNGSSRPPAGGTGGTYGQPKRKIKPRWGRIALVLGGLALVVALLIGGGVWLYGVNLNSKLQKTDPFSSIVGDRPLKTVDGAMNVLLVGSDSRDPDTDMSQASSWRADTIVVVHISADHQHAYLVSIPRDLYVYIPKTPGAQYGDTYAKINASFAWGGLPMAVQTVENYSGVRIDHVVSIDFGGLKEVVDALGGVDMYVDRTIKSIHKPFRTFQKGNRHFDGAEALDYVRQRKQFPDGDFARMRHQQALLKAMLDKATSAGVMANPGKLNAFLQTLTKAVTVDKDFALTDMVLQFRSMSSDKLTFLTSPNLGSATRDGESVVLSDKTKALALYDAMAKDTMEAYVTANATSSPSAS